MSRSFFWENIVFDLISRLVHRVIVRGHAVKDIFILVPVQWSVVGRQRDMEEKVSTVSHGQIFRVGARVGSVPSKRGSN